MNQKGFSLVEGLLIVIALSIVGFVGFYVFNENEKSNSEQNKSTSSKASKENSSADERAEKNFVFKELGVQVKTNTEINDIEYKVDNESGGKALSVGTRSLKKAFEACGATAEITTYPFGVQRGEGKFEEAGPYVTLTKQFDSFYITTSAADGGASSACSESASQNSKDAADQKASKVINALKDAFKNAETVQ